MESTDSKKIFSSNQLKNTKQREAVFNILQDDQNALSVNEIYDQLLKQNENINLSTIYRILHVFESKKLIVKHHMVDENSTVYALNRMDHKHFLICTACNNREEITHCPMSTLEKSLANETQYMITGHKLEIYGLCPKCLKNYKSKEGLVVHE